MDPQNPDANTTPFSLAEKVGFGLTTLLTATFRGALVGGTVAVIAVAFFPRKTSKKGRG
jgi:uncharacterized membrane protein